MAAITSPRNESLRLNSAVNLPNEVLLAIFQATRNIRRKRDHLPYIVLVSHVCRSWRTLALGTPGLWTWIDLANCGNNDMYYAFLARSYPRLLHVTLFVGSAWSRPMNLMVGATNFGRAMRNLSDLVNIIVREIGRITSLHITVNDFQTTLAFVLPRLRTLRAPMLRYFGTSRDDVPRFSPKPQSGDLFQGGAPLLTSARISALVLGVPPLENLSTLIIHRPHEYEQSAIRYIDLRKMLVASSRLEHLIFEGRVIEREDIEKHKPIILPHLISLHIELENEHESGGHAFMFYLLHTPAIRSLTLVNGMATSIIGSFLTFCESRPPTPYPHLRRLSLNGGGSIGPLITQLARALPLVEDLRCIIWNTSDLLVRLTQGPRCARCKSFHIETKKSHEDLVTRVRESGETPYWPNLRSFTFQYAGDSALIDFILARELIGCPIKELRTSQFTNRMTTEWEKRLHDHGVKVVSVDVELEEHEQTEPYRHEEFELDDIPLFARQI